MSPDHGPGGTLWQKREMYCRVFAQGRWTDPSDKGPRQARPLEPSRCPSFPAVHNWAQPEAVTRTRTWFPTPRPVRQTWCVGPCPRVRGRFIIGETRHLPS